jgi:nucleoside-diphosphate-sugar epimerase
VGVAARRSAQGERVVSRDDPVFKTIGQLLYHAFAMEVRGASIKGGTAIVLEDLMEQRYGRPQRDTERSVNLSGLTWLDFGAQCARIRQLIGERPNHIGLERFEQSCVQARFGFQATRAKAIIGLADHLQTLCNSRARDAVGALIYAIYSPAKPTRVRRRGKDTDGNDQSLRKIERETGISKSTLHRDQKLMRELIYATENRAQQRLEAYFVNAGLLEDGSA